MNAGTYVDYAPAPPLGMFADDDADDIFDLPVDGFPDDEPEVETPREADTTVQMRPYQVKAGHDIDRELRDNQSTLCLSATGTGKSIVIADLTRRYAQQKKNVLLLVHRDELIRQLSKACSRMGVPAAVEKAGEHALPAVRAGMVNAVCASVQTLRGNRLESWARDAFDLIVIDEAHHAMADGYIKTLKHFGFRNTTGAHQPKVVGFTATADRLDGKNIGCVFQTRAFEYNLRDAVMDGWLVRPMALTLETEPPIDLRTLRTSSKADFTIDELEKVITASLSSIVNAIAEDGRLEKRRAIAFTPDVNSAQLLSEALNDVGITANWIAGNSPDRAAKFKAHQNGEFQVLCNCQLTTEGYDDPHIEAVILCRPTKSRGLYSQMVGRGTRLCEAIDKKDCYLVDFNWLTTSHDLVKAVDLFDNGDLSDEVMVKAREELEPGALVDLQDAVEAGQEKHRLFLREKIRRQKLPVRAGMFDPLGIADFFDIPMQKEAYAWENVRMASEKQINALRKWQINAPDEMPFAIAKKMLDTVIARAEHGWASMRQVNALIESGIDSDVARGMRKEEAAQHLDANPLPPSDGQRKFLKWKRVPEAEIAAMTRKEASARISSIKESEG